MPIQTVNGRRMTDIPSPSSREDVLVEFNYKPFPPIPHTLFEPLHVPGTVLGAGIRHGTAWSHLMVSGEMHVPGAGRIPIFIEHHVCMCHALTATCVPGAWEADVIPILQVRN